MTFMTVQICENIYMHVLARKWLSDWRLVDVNAFSFQSQTVLSLRVLNLSSSPQLKSCVLIVDKAYLHSLPYPSVPIQ